jgi:chitinase
MKLLGLVAVTWMACWCGMAQAAGNTDADHPMRVVAYYPSRVKSNYPCTQVDFSRMTHLAQAFVWPLTDGTLNVPANFLYPELVQAAHAHGVKVIVSMGGGSKSGNFAAMANDPGARSNFVGQLTAFCVKNGYDGADIDWEAPENATDMANFTSLVREIRAAFDAAKPHMSLSAAIQPSPRSGKWLDLDQVKNDLDWLGVMTYGWHGPWSKYAGHNAPLYGSTADPRGPTYCDDGSIQYYLSRHVPREKLLLGIPLYARVFNATNLYANSTGGDWIVYADVQQKLASGWTRVWDATSMVPYLVNPSHTQLVTYDDPLSVQYKCEYVAKQGLGGVIVWSLGQDLYEGQTPLLTVIGSNLLRTASVPPKSD